MHTTSLMQAALQISHEEDEGLMLSHALHTAMALCRCDRGIWYEKKEGLLAFRLHYTKSTETYLDFAIEATPIPPLPITRQNLCTLALMEDRVMHIADLEQEREFDVSVILRMEQGLDYKTKSMLLLPVRHPDGEVAGLVQLINAVDNRGAVCGFSDALIDPLLQFISLTEVFRQQQQSARAEQALLDTMVQALSAAIYARTPFHVSHTSNMVLFADRFIDWLNAQQHDWQFSPSHKRNFLMSVWLHDVGKLIIPLDVLNKSARLGIKLDRVMQRLTEIGLLARLEEAKGGSPCAAVLEKVENTRTFILYLNTHPEVSAELLQELQELATLRYRDVDGVELPWLTEDELDDLSIRYGSFNANDRATMERHVEMTAHILSKVNFEGAYANIPRWATAHHEFLDGSGYPNGLSAKDLSKEARLLTILDVFEGLSADNRSYRPAIPFESVFSILHNMVNDGRLDAGILALFEESRAWED